MKLKVETLVRIYIVALLVVLGWCMWCSSTLNDDQAHGNPLPGSGSDKDGQSKLDPKAGQSTPKPVPVWIEKLSVKLSFLKWELWGTALWKYLFSFVYIFLAFYVSKLVDYLTRVWLRRGAEKTKTKFDDLLLELLRGPVKIVVFVFSCAWDSTCSNGPRSSRDTFTKGSPSLLQLRSHTLC